jgi:hypothetical protein
MSVAPVINGSFADAAVNQLGPYKNKPERSTGLDGR